jgi:hypothetical protein
MDDEETYQLHQTPAECAKDLIAFIPLVAGDIVLEPFRGEGAFYNNFPDNVIKGWAEIKEGRDYTELVGGYDWVITNPPFKLDTGQKKVNSFWFLLDYFSQRARKGIAFLGNDRCFSVLTPKRMDLLKQRGFKIVKIVVCSIKKWRGRYFFIVLQKEGQSLMDSLITNY